MVVRTLLAVFLALQRAERPWRLVGQAASDFACTLFLLGYASAPVREALGVLAVPLLLYAVGWEARLAVQRFGEFFDTGVGDTESYAEAMGHGGLLIWQVLFVAPPLAAGLLLAFDRYAPDELPFPDSPRPVACAPAAAEQGDAVTIRMATPHGALRVTTPDGRQLYLLPPGREHRLRRIRLDSDRVTGTPVGSGLPERVFADTGAYRFSLLYASVDPTGPEIWGECGVRYRATGRPPP